MIRKVTPDDAQAITDIYNPFITHTTVTFETEPVSVDEMRRRIVTLSADYPYYVYEHQGQVLGYCYLHAWKPRVAYARTLEVTIYLAPEAQGHDVGRSMISRLVADARQLGVQALIACITEENTHSMAFHRAMGFKQVSHFESVGYKFGRMLDVVDFELLLV